MARVLQFPAYPTERAPAHLASFRAERAPPSRARTPSSPYAWSRPRRRLAPTVLFEVETSREPVVSASSAPVTTPRASDHPIAVGVALPLCPPLGIAMLWASPRYSDEARRAVTGFVAVCLALAALLIGLR